MYTKQVGRFTIKIEHDYDAPFDTPNDWGNGILIADNRNFYTLNKGETFYQAIYKNIEGKKIFPLYWNLYSSASNPVLRHLEEEITIEDLEEDKKVVIIAKDKEEAEMTMQHWKSYFEDSYYQFIIENEDGEVIESIGGFQESEYDIENTYCYQEALSIAKKLEKEALKEDKKIKEKAKILDDSETGIDMKTTLSEMLLSKNPQIQRLAKGIYKEINTL